MAQDRPIAIGLASGLGNAVFMLPTIAALHRMGRKVSLHVETDFPTAAIWRRCQYADEVLEPPSALNGHIAIWGQWRPSSWRTLPAIYRAENNFPYRFSEWESNFRLAKMLGWPHGIPPKVSDWCRDLDRTPRWDIGIVPGSKGGVWLRKRWPGMTAVAGHFLGAGKSVATFGLDADGVDGIPGERIETTDISKLPDVLAGCRVIVGTDSGVTQLASSLGIPSVVIFTATSKIKGEPVGPHIAIAPDLKCQPCQSSAKWYQCSDWKCRSIDPEIVIEAAEGLLESSSQ